MLIGQLPLTSRPNFADWLNTSQYRLHVATFILHNMSFLAYRPQPHANMWVEDIGLYIYTIMDRTIFIKKNQIHTEQFFIVFVQIQLRLLVMYSFDHFFSQTHAQCTTDQSCLVYAPSSGVGHQQCYPVDITHKFVVRPCPIPVSSTLQLYVQLILSTFTTQC